MSARILIVDDLPTNLKLLEAKLTADYYSVVSAESGAQALERARTERPDIILLDVMMPEMDGFETCRRLNADPATAHIPVVMVTALTDVQDRVQGLEAGADDFLSKPVNDLILFARVRSLVRLKRSMDEWRLREETCDRFGVLASQGRREEPSASSQVLVVESDAYLSTRLATTLEEEGHRVRCVNSDAEALDALSTGEWDLMITSLYLDGGDGLRLCSRVRAEEALRTLPILLVIEPEEMGGLAKGFDLGINDYLIRPIDPNELRARAITQLRHRRYRRRLQETYRRSLSMALTDDLTGLYNHRYMCAHMETALDRVRNGGKTLSLLMIDIDHFKRVNDTHGHAFGDEVLRRLAASMNRNIREFDMAARRGGEEFVVIMPDSEPEDARRVAERLRRLVQELVLVPGPGKPPVPVTISIGVAWTRDGLEDADGLMTRADRALYAAKNAGRNRIECQADIPNVRSGVMAR